MVFDNQDGVAGLHQPLQAIQQALNIREMQTGGGLVENVKVMPTAPQFAQLGGEFDPLRLPTGQDGGRMAQFEVAEAKGVQYFQLADDSPLVGEEAHGFFN